jgi:hypothetical protein
VWKPKGLATFLKSDAKMQWLAMLTRDTGIPASRRLGIKDEVAALDFDFAVSFRLFQLRQEEQKGLAKRIVFEIAKWWAGDKSEDDDSVLGSEYLDKYCDENTKFV